MRGARGERLLTPWFVPTGFSDCYDASDLIWRDAHGCRLRWAAAGDLAGCCRRGSILDQIRLPIRLALTAGMGRPAIRTGRNRAFSTKCTAIVKERCPAAHERRVAPALGRTLDDIGQ